MTRAAIVQSNYIPWRGYFSLISNCDVFVILDSVQYTKRDWRNRNQLREREGLFWLTIPVEKLSTRESIYDVRVSDSSWVSKHLTSARHSLAGLPFFESALDAIEPVFRSLESEASLHTINMALI
ncbi:MAG: WbqC family protein, partial [Actinomycetota bacterium]